MAWAGERSLHWSLQVPKLVRVASHLDGEGLRDALLHGILRWLVDALAHSRWQEAQRAVWLLDDLDRERTRSGEELTAALTGMDTARVAESLDHGEAEDLARFFAVVVAIGAPAVDLACTVIAHARLSRTLAAASTALGYLCSDHPERLEPYLRDPRTALVQQVVSVLGQIGGRGVVPLLRQAARHADANVQRQVIQALGSVPHAERLPILLQDLDTRDPHLLSAILNLLTRERSRAATTALLAMIESPGFESRTEANRHVLFKALADVADESAVPALQAIVLHGGWFARPSFRRSEAARVLRQIGGERARAALESGLGSRNEAVRAACRAALSWTPGT